MTQTLLLLVSLGTAGLIALAFYFNNVALKYLTVAALFFLANLMYFSLDGVKGWPAEEPIEVKGILASVVIVNPSSEESGGIYISLFPTLPKKWYEYEYPRLAPKTYFVEYSNDRAAEFELAKQAMEEGKEVRINGIPPKEGKGNGEGEEGETPDSTVQMILETVKKLLPKENDTYKPEAPAVEILTQTTPPSKESSQK
jgi:hypothetical protein